MNTRVDAENVRSIGMGKLRIRQVSQFSSNAFWENIGCSFWIQLLVFVFKLCGRSRTNKGYTEIKVQDIT